MRSMSASPRSPAAKARSSAGEGQRGGLTVSFMTNPGSGSGPVLVQVPESGFLFVATSVPLVGSSASPQARRLWLRKAHKRDACGYEKTSRELPLAYQNARTLHGAGARRGRGR